MQKIEKEKLKEEYKRYLKKFLKPIDMTVFLGEYNYCGDFHEGLAAVKIKQKYGYINKNGKQVIRCKYIDCDAFHEGLAVIVVEENPEKLHSGQLCGYVNKDAEEIVVGKYPRVLKFSQGMGLFSSNRWNDSRGIREYFDGFVDKNGNEICKYKTCYSFCE